MTAPALAKLVGVIPPVITPYDRDGNIAPLALRELIEWYVASGCNALWVCGGTGEGISLSDDERARMIDLAMEAAAGRIGIAFHVGAATTASAVAAARRCQQAGVDAVSSVPPFFYGKSDREIVSYFRQLADETDRPLFLYNLPDATGYSLSVTTIAKILEAVPEVVGIKHSGTTMDLVVELLRLKSDLTVIVGRGELTLAGLVLGAKGVVCASLCLAPERFVKLHRHFQAGQLREAMQAQQWATRVKELYGKFPVIGSTKWVNSRQIGMDCGPPRGPLAGIEPDQESALAQMAQQLGLLEERSVEPMLTGRHVPR